MNEIQPSPYRSPEIYVEREMAATDDQRVEAFSAVSGLVRVLSSSPLIERETQINGIELQSGMVPPDMRRRLRGLDFGKLDIAITGLKPQNQSAAIKFYPRRLGENRVISVDEAADEDFMDVTDSNAAKVRAQGAELHPRVLQSDVARYLALQLLRDRDEAQNFVITHGPRALTVAANLLAFRGKEKIEITTSGQEVKLSARHQPLLSTQSLLRFTPDDGLQLPTHVLHSAWLTEDYQPRAKGLPKLTRRTIVEYSPTGNRPPGDNHTDIESIRVALTAPASIDPDLVQTELERVATVSGPQLLDYLSSAWKLLQAPRQR